jgi:hypothetical protein
MWLNESSVSKYSLPILNTPRWDFEAWAHTNLPGVENKYNHPYCRQIETILIRALRGNLASLTSLGKIPVAKYVWKGNQLVLQKDHCPNILDLTDETGTNYLGGYLLPSVYSYPCVGVAPHRRIEGEYIPIFLTDEQLAQREYWDRRTSLLFRARPLDLDDFQTKLKEQLIRMLR